MSHGASDETSWLDHERSAAPGTSSGAGAGAAGAASLYLFPELARATWWRSLLELERTIRTEAPAHVLAGAYATLLGELAAEGYADIRRAAAAELLGGTGPLSAYAAQHVPAGLLFALEKDLEFIHHATGQDLTELVSERLGEAQPPLRDLAAEYPPGVLGEAVSAVEAALLAREPKRRVELFTEAMARFGSGPSALYGALVYADGALAGLTEPDTPDWGELFGLDEQLGRLEANVEALLARTGAHHTLLYGPRGSGKSTAVRGLLRRFEGRGLRLVEVPPAQLESIPAFVESLRRQPTAFVIYVDDLAFEEGETAYRPLKSLLEGSLARRPSNVIVVATSNRRHLVKERISDRPAPEDDVHGWDTHNEKLALADRFGLTITFPSAGQREYLRLVRALAALRGVTDFPEEQAIRFAEWGNGYSGRTAQQFVRELTRERKERVSR